MPLRRPLQALKLLGRGVEVLLLLLLLAAGALALRLASGPIPLDTFQPYLKRLVESSVPFAVAFDHPALAWSRRQNTLLLRVENLELRTPANALVVAAPAVALRLDAPALVRNGAIRLREMEVSLPALQLVREADQRLVLGFEGHLASLPLGEATGGNVFQRLAGGAAEAGDQRFRYLRRIAVAASSLQFTDAASGRRIDSGAARLQLTHGNAGWQLALDVEALGGAAASKLRVRANPSNGSAEQQVQVELESLPPAALAGLLPNVDLSPFTLPVSAQVRFSLDPATRTPGPGRFRVSVAAGTVTAPALFQAPVRVQSALVSGTADAGWQAITVAHGELHLPGMTLQLAGSAARSATGQSLALDLTADHLDAGQLKQLWPLPLAPKTRDWVVGHIDGGEAPKARLQLSRTAGDTPQLDYRLAFALQGGAARFLPDWPAATGLVGDGLLDRDSFHLDLTAGRVGEVTSDKAVLVFTGLRGADTTRLAVTLDAAGPVPVALDLLARKPIELARRLAISPKATSGKAEASVTFALPLHPDLKAAEVTKQVTASLSDLAVQQVRKGFDLGRGSLRVKLDDARAEITGDIAVNTVPLTLSWLERLDTGPERRRIEAKGGIDADRARALGLPWPDGVTGSVPVAAEVSDADRKPRRVELDGDLAGLAVALPDLGLVKRAGEAGRLHASLEQPDERHLSVSSATLGWSGVELRGGAELRLAPGGWERVDIAAARTPAAELSLSLFNAPTALRATVTAQRLDLRPARSRDRSADGPGPPNLDLDLKSASVFLGDEPLTGVALRAARRDGRLTAAEVTAGLPGGGNAQFSLAADRLPGSYSGEIGDLGGLLRGLGLPQSRIEGGRGRVAGQIEDRAGEPVWTGEAKLRDLTVRDAPLLARILTLASLQGLSDTLAGRGLQVERITLPFTWSTGKVELAQVRAVGSGLGARVDGTVGLADRSLALTGTVAPLYALNHLIGQIPIVGDLLRGDRSDALLAATFSVDGSFDSPQVSVNPLAVLVPGVVRDLLGDLFDGADRPAAP